MNVRGLERDKVITGEHLVNALKAEVPQTTRNRFPQFVAVPSKQKVRAHHILGSTSVLQIQI
jgi:vacuolar-type H+-ATPase subunit F/Vma7